MFILGGLGVFNFFLRWMEMNLLGMKNIIRYINLMIIRLEQIKKVFFI